MLNQQGKIFSLVFIFQHKCASLVSPQWREWDKIKNELQIDEFLKRILNDLSQGSVVHDGFEWRDGLLFYKG